MKQSGKLLLFNVNEIKAALIKQVCDGLNIGFVKIYQHQYGEKIGALAGIPVFDLINEPYQGAAFKQEMMVMCGLTPDQLDAFLEAYKDAGIPPIRLKAAMTAYNMTWTAARLYSELAKEDKQLHG